MSRELFLFFKDSIKGMFVCSWKLSTQEQQLITEKGELLGKSPQGGSKDGTWGMNWVPTLTGEWPVHYGARGEGREYRVGKCGSVGSGPVAQRFRVHVLLQRPEVPWFRSIS